MSELINFLDKLNWQGIIAIFSIVWYFTHDIKVAIEKQSDRMEKQAARTDKLYEMFIDLLKEKK